MLADIRAPLNPFGVSLALLGDRHPNTCTDSITRAGGDLLPWTARESPTATRIQKVRKLAEQPRDYCRSDGRQPPLRGVRRPPLRPQHREQAVPNLST